MKLENPFVVGRYAGAAYFCDRKVETRTLVHHLTNGRDVALIAPRRLGKSGLIEHTFATSVLANDYYTFFIDIYATKSYAELVYLLGKNIYEQLKPRQTKWTEQFFQYMKSLQVGISFDPVSTAPTLNLKLGDITSPQTTLDELFTYIEMADKPCLIAIDEFQQIMYYPDGVQVEAELRTKIQHCKNAHFIFSGSRRHMMTQIFLSASKPFYQSAIAMSLSPIPLEEYSAFVHDKFSQAGKQIQDDVIGLVYHRFDGISWYIQMMMNELYALTAKGETCVLAAVDTAFRNIIDSHDQLYREMFSMISSKQKELLLAIAQDEQAQSITSQAFIRHHRLPSASSVQSACRALIDADVLTQEDGMYRIYDYFFSEWLRLSRF